MLIEQIQSMYRQADATTGGVHVIKIHEHKDGSVTYVTSECKMHYFKAGRPNLHTKTTYDVEVKTKPSYYDQNNPKGWLSTDQSKCRYHMRTKAEAMAYFKQIVKE